MKIKDLLRRSQFVFSIRILIEHLRKTCYYSRQLANRARRDNSRDMLTDLMVRGHAIEKGMSIGNVRIGFGVPKALAIIKDLQTYLDKGGSREFAVATCSILNNYTIFNERGGVNLNTVKEALSCFLKRNELDLLPNGGILHVEHSDIRNGALGNFSELSQCRHAVRDFGDDPVDLEKIRKALMLCEHTPSACNRQSWRIHVYSNKELKNRIFDLQSGCKGFHDGMQIAILICGDTRNYGFPEFSSVYVDGGIYAMNLMYALNYYDLATIPLTLALSESRIRDIRRLMKIPKNEIPVLLIGVGTYKEKFRVAESHRMRHSEYVTFNE